jgi:hypothetical protein
MNQSSRPKKTLQDFIERRTALIDRVPENTSGHELVQAALISTGG